MSDTPTTDPDVLAAFGNQAVTGKPVTDADVIAAFGPPKLSRVVHGGAYENDPSTPEWQAKYGPMSGTDPLTNLAAAGGMFMTDRALGARQALTFDPTKSAALEQEAAEKAKLDEPLARSWQGHVGPALAALPLAFLPGVNTGLGAAALGGTVGATQPTQGGDSRLLNTAVGSALGLGAQKVGGGVANWATGRAVEPFMGWSPTTSARAAAQSVGSDAPRLDQDALADTHKRLTDIFNRARSPNVNVPVSDPTLNALDASAGGLNQSSRAAYYASDQVKDLTSHLGSSPTAAQLGQISSQLGREAAAQMTSKGGDRALGRAYFALQDHVDGLVGSSITDPALSQAYSAALPQYRNFLTLSSRPTLLNSSTGDLNASALGRYLQRADPAGYTRGGNTSPLYQAARWGQATGEGKGAPPFSIENLGVPWMKYHALNNPVAQATGGVASRAVAPVAPAISRLSQALVMPANPPSSDLVNRLRKSLQAAYAQQ